MAATFLTFFGAVQLDRNLQPFQSPRRGMAQLAGVTGEVVGDHDTFRKRVAAGSNSSQASCVRREFWKGKRLVDPAGQDFSAWRR